MPISKESKNFTVEEVAVDVGLGVAATVAAIAPHPAAKVAGGSLAALAQAIDEDIVVTSTTSIEEDPEYAARVASLLSMGVHPDDINSNIRVELKGATTGEPLAQIIGDGLSDWWDSAVEGFRDLIDGPNGGGSVSSDGGNSGDDGQESTPSPSITDDPDGWGPPVGDRSDRDLLLPIAMDLNGDGVVSVQSQDTRSTYFDGDGDGFVESVGWIANGDGFLVDDIDGNGKLRNERNLTTHEELVFSARTDAADTDLEALAKLHDTNQDGVINSDDAYFSRLKVWVESVDQNGEVEEGELKTLTELGINSINVSGEWRTSDQLTQAELDNWNAENAATDITITGANGAEATKKAVTLAEGNTLFGVTSFTRVDAEGNEESYAAADIALSTSSLGYRLKDDGSGQIEFQIEGRDGQVESAMRFVNQGQGDTTIDLAESNIIGATGAEGDDTLDASGYANGSAVVIDGGDGADVVNGGTGNDWLTGGAGADTVNGGAGKDIVFTDGADTLNGGEGYDMAIALGPNAQLSLDLGATEFESAVGGELDDTLDGSSAGEGVYLSGKSGNDSLIGSSHDDVLSGGEGADVLRGGAGNDVVIADAADLQDGIVSGGANGEKGDTLVISDNESVTINMASHDFESVIGGNGNDSITGTSSGDTIDGSGGADTLHGGEGNDMLVVDQADLDNGEIDGGFGRDAIVIDEVGGMNVDLKAHNAEAGIGAVGDDTIDASGVTTYAYTREVTERYLIRPEGENNHAQYGTRMTTETAYATANVYLNGKQGDDTLIGSVNGDELIGGEGNDSITGGAGNDKIYGGEGDDTLLSGGAGNDSITGGVGNDRIDGGSGTNSLFFNRGDGHDRVVMGGYNLLIFDKSVSINDLWLQRVDGNGKVSASGSDLKVLVMNEDQSVTVEGFFDASNAMDIRAIGNAVRMPRANIIKLTEAMAGQAAPTGGNGSPYRQKTGAFQAIENLINNSWWSAGYYGDDENLNYTDGANYANPGSKDDHTIRTYGGNDHAKGNRGEDFIMGGSGNDRLKGGDNQDVVVGGTGDDTISGDDNNDILHGDQGKDTIHGGSGNDSIYGGDGRDHAYGGSGNDTIEGGTGNDELHGGDGKDTIRGGDGEDDIYGDAGEDDLYGDGDKDNVFGGTGADYISGGDGDDTLQGGDEADHITGGDGDDDLYGDAGNDELRGEAGDDDIFGGLGDDVLRGGDGDDTIYGYSKLAYPSGDDDDTIEGGAGNDTITGGMGDDVINGGSGTDTVRFAGKFADFEITVLSSGALQFNDKSEQEGVDRVSNVERFIFRDKTATFEELRDAARQKDKDQQGDDPANPAGPSNPLPSFVFKQEGQTSFNGTSQASVKAHDPSTALASGTLFFRFRAEDLKGRQGLVSKDATGLGKGGDFSVYLDGGRLYARLQGDKSRQKDRLVKSSVSAGQMHEVAVAFGAGGFKLYYDGKLVAQDGYTGGLQNNTQALAIGASRLASKRGDSKVGDHFHGEVKNVHLFNEVLDANAVKGIGALIDAHDASGDGNAGSGGDNAGSGGDNASSGGDTGSGDNTGSGGNNDGGNAGSGGNNDGNDGGGSTNKPTDLDKLVAAQAGAKTYSDTGNATVMAHNAAMATAEGTLYLRFKADDLSGRQGLVSKDATGYGPGGDFGLYLDGSKLYLRMQSAGASFVLAAYGIKAGKEYEVSVAFGPGGVSLLVDGRVVDTDSYSGGLTANEEPLVIGGLTRSSARGAGRVTDKFAGTIEDVHLFSKKMSTAEIGGLADKIAKAYAGGSNDSGNAGGSDDGSGSAGGGSNDDNGSNDDSGSNDDGGSTKPDDVNRQPGMLLPNVGYAAMPAMRFGGSGGDVVKVAHDPAMAIASGTLSMRFTANKVSGRQGVISKDASGKNPGDFTVYLNDNSLIVRFENNDGRHVYLGGGRVTAGKEVRLSVNFGAEGVEVYRDGALASSGNFSRGFEANTEMLIIGGAGWYSGRGDSHAANFFNGTVSDVRMYQERLSASQINGLDGAHMTTTDVKNYRFDSTAANELMVGDIGADLYDIQRGDGRDRIEDKDGNDTVQFTKDVTHDQLWFSKDGHDLEISVIGTDQSVTVADWYKGKNHRIESIEAGGKAITDAKVDRLVQAMAAFQPPANGELDLPQTTRDGLSTALAANWQTKRAA